MLLLCCVYISRMQLNFGIKVYDVRDRVLLWLLSFWIFCGGRRCNQAEDVKALQS